MNKDAKLVDDRNKCELCQQQLNCSAWIHNSDTKLCKACFHRMEVMPDLVERCVERMVIGNIL